MSDFRAGLLILVLPARLSDRSRKRTKDKYYKLQAESETEFIPAMPRRSVIVNEV